MPLRERAAGCALPNVNATEGGGDAWSPAATVAGGEAEQSGGLEEAVGPLDEDTVILTGVMEDGEEDEHAGGHGRGQDEANQLPPRPPTQPTVLLAPS